MHGWLRRFSIRSRLSVIIAGAVGLTVALASLSVYFVARHQLLKQVDDSLSSTADNVFHLSRDGTLTQFQLQEFVARGEQSGDLLSMVAPTGAPIFSSPVVLPDTAADRAVAATQGDAVYRTEMIGKVPYRIITIGNSPSTGTTIVYNGVPIAVEIAHPLTELNGTLTTLRLILFVVSLAGVGLAVGLGYLVARTTIRPVQRLTAAAEHVAGTQDLGATIDESGDDELTRLARAFNAMLAALDASRQQQAQLISDAGHELRTPLTSLRTNVEVLIRVYDLPPADRVELLADVQAQLEELTQLIGDVVELGRHDEQQAEPTEVRFDQLVERAVERARRRAPSLTFQVQLEHGSVRAQPALLERAVLNVLDNAAKWSPSGGTVEVWLQHRDSWLLDVRDHGPGIAPEDLPKVFDRFYRAQKARSMSGSGLGLAIVRQVVTDHGGTATIWCPSDGGTVVHIELPTVPEEEPDSDSNWLDSGDRRSDPEQAAIFGPDSAPPGPAPVAPSPGDLASHQVFRTGSASLHPAVG